MLNRSRGAFIFILLVFALSAGCTKSEAPPQGAPPAAPAVATSAPAAPAPAGDSGGEVLFGQKCSICHDLSMATSRKETRETWA
ncbi:MAG: hypothetical protein AB1346_05615, partial [Thermodesulfobacteriota bacterium]